MARALRLPFFVALGMLGLAAVAALGLWAVAEGWPHHVDARFQERCQTLRPGMTLEQARAWMPPGWAYAGPTAAAKGQTEVGEISLAPLTPVDGGLELVWSHSNTTDVMACRRYTCVISFDAQGARVVGSKLLVRDLGCD